MTLEHKHDFSFLKIFNFDFGSEIRDKQFVVQMRSAKKKKKKTFTRLEAI